MTNPTRPADGQTIITTWGLAVADTVVRRYPNAATRDTDLTGHTATDLLGQLCVLTNTGELLQYAGPAVGWRPPWSMPWGRRYHAATAVGLMWNGGSTPLIAFTTPLDVVAGRQYRIDVSLNMFALDDGWVDYQVVGTQVARQNVINVAATGPSRAGPWTSFIYWSAPATVAGQVLSIATGGPVNAGGLDSGRLSVFAITDVGPAANPTALVLNDAGELTVDLERLEPEYRELWTPAGALEG